jgi:hypothetical protein
MLRQILATSRAIGAVAVLAPAPALARADPGTVGITWTAPAECPTASEVEASIRDLLGHVPRLFDGRRLEVDARAEKKRDGEWTATIVTQTGTTTGSRVLATESCRAAADATALIVALMIDPQAVAARDAPPVVEAKQATTAPPLRPETTVSRGPPPPRRGPALRFSLGPAIAIDRGTLPQPTYAAGGRAGVKLGASVLELGVLASASASGTVAGTSPPAGGSFHFLSASLAACPAIAARWFDLGVCAEIEVTQVKGSGFGVTSSYENDARWLAPGGGVLARLRVAPHVAIPLRIDAVAPLVQTTFFLEGVPEARGRVYIPSRVAGRALVAVDVDL